MIAKLLIFSLAAALPARALAEDAASIVRKAVDQYTRNEETLRNYTWKSLAVEREFDAKGNVKATHSRLNEVLYIGGQRKVRLLEKDGKPLPEGEAKREQEKLDRAAREAANLSPEQRKAREAENTKQRERESMRHVPDVYDMAMVREQNVNGRPTWEIHLTPRRDYKGPDAFVYRNIEATVWIDKQDSSWVRMEADARDTIVYGLFIARLAKGMHISMERSRVNDEVWALKSLSMKGSARLALVKNVNADVKVTFSDYRRFSTDSRLVDPQ
jgi:hypothetical protein